MRYSGSIRIVTTGVGLPNGIMTNEFIKEKMNTDIDCGWVEEKLGIKQRRIIDANEFTSDLAAQAANHALERAGISSNSIDMLIVATITQDNQTPSTACIVQQKTGMKNAVSFDLSAACSGFLFGLDIASAVLSANKAKRIMVIGADVLSRVTNWSKRDCVFFGDGAGAVILEQSNYPNSLFDAQLYSDGAKKDAFVIPASVGKFEMNAKAVFDAATHAVPLCAEKLLIRNEMSVEDIDIVIPHQPSKNLLAAISEKLQIPFCKFQINIDNYANTAAATIPIMLHESVENSKLKKDDLILFATAGAGFTAGAAVYRWH